MPMGLMWCPVPGCQCAATCGPEAAATLEEVHETRALVRETLARLGLEVPPFLR